MTIYLSKNIKSPPNKHPNAKLNGLSTIELRNVLPLRAASEPWKGHKRKCHTTTHHKTTISSVYLVHAPKTKLNYYNMYAT